MSNLRTIPDNAADRATITASSTTGAMIAAHMQNDTKGLAHRSVGTAVTYTLAFPRDETVGGVALPASNLGPSATARVRAYDALAGGSLLVDSGVQYACPAVPFEMLDWTQRMGAHQFNPDPGQAVTVNLFAYGFATKCAVWLDAHYAARRLEIELSDPDNPAGFIDCSRIVAGGVWSPTYNPSYGAGIEIVDMSASTRAASGDRRDELEPQYDRQSLQLDWLEPNDRARMSQMMRATTSNRNLFLDLYPDAADPRQQQDAMIYGHVGGGGLVAAYYRVSSRTIQIEGW